LQQKLLEYTKNYLTTDKIAEYILKEVNCTRNAEGFICDELPSNVIDANSLKNVSRILYLSSETTPDYLRCVTLHGFKMLFGSNCHDYPKVPHIYKTNDINYNGLYGKGISYSNLLDQQLHCDELDTTIYEDIKNKNYDIVIYGSYHRGMPFYVVVCEIYKPHEIILLCGEDIQPCLPCNYNHFVNKGHHVFVREL
jgi:hypothetical protein